MRNAGIYDGGRSATTADDRMENKHSERRHPTHQTLVERHNQPVVVMITVCTPHRKAVLASSEMHDTLIEAWNQSFDWRVGTYVIMPDHIHLFCIPARWPIGNLKQWVSYWKRLMSIKMPQYKPLWQRDFWDTQMRNYDHYVEKVSYVRQNPVRKGLVSDSKDWPFAGELNPIIW